MDWLQRLAKPSQAQVTIPQIPLHPFYPTDILLSDYVANDVDLLFLIGTFLGGWVVILGATWLALSRYVPRLQNLDKMTILWFVLTGTIHFFFEGFFVLNHTRMTSSQHYFGQLWKEYSLSDSRYMFSDPFVLCMETITMVCWGPLSYLVAIMIAKAHPLRYPIQAIVSLGQIYGDVLYYATSLFDLYYKGLSYCRPEGYYFWFYFFFMNAIWIVIPGLLLFQSASKTAEAFRALDKISQVYAANGSAKEPKPATSKDRAK